MDEGSSPLWGCMIFIIFIVCNGILYGFSAAIQNISESDMEKRAKEGDKKAGQIIRLLENPAKLVNTIQIVSTLVSVLTGYLGLRIFTKLFRDWLISFQIFQNFTFSLLKIIAFVTVLLLALVLLLGLGIFAPKKICRHYAASSVRVFLNPVMIIMCLFTPITFLVSRFSNIIVRIFGIDPYKKSDVTEEEIINIVDEAHEQGVILEREAEMIQNIIQFSDKVAKDIMTHRNQIHALDGDMTLDEAIHIMLEESNSRYPVYLKDIDNIIGIIYLKDAMKQVTYHQNGNLAIRDISDLIRAVAFIPETRGIDDIFKCMQAKKVHIMIVIDEYGQTAGLVAMEDILEEIVGNILDEYDDEEEFIHPQIDDSILMDGLTPLEQVAAVLNVTFDEEDEDFETLNGYLTSLLEHIPNLEDKEVVGKGYLFEILSIENNIIQKVRVEKIQDKGEERCQDIQSLPT